jgi:hypothetical protein
MSSLIAFKVAGLLALCLCLMLTLVLIWALPRLRWWPECAFQLIARPKLGLWRASAVLIGSAALLVLALPPGLGLPLTPLVWLTIAPHLAAAWTTRAAWKSDPLETRLKAARVRNRLLERRGEDARVSADQLWAEYVIDEARAARQANYRPPGL